MRSSVAVVTSAATFEREIMNNDVYDGRGKLVGFRCSTCGDVFPSMWDVTCNRCRLEEERHAALLAVLRSKGEVIT